VSLPVPAAGEVLVKTIAVSINPIDWKLRRGELKEMMPIEFPAILGRDLSGEVFALGEGVTGLKVGDRVFGLVVSATRTPSCSARFSVASCLHGHNETAAKSRLARVGQ
jgi:NADPH:quinone reductase-like Zn-dependent oxidoreductase